VEIVAEVGVELGYSSLKTEQTQAILKFLQGKDVFVVLPTGYGKSLCYACLPLVFDRVFGRLSTNERSIAVVISPLIALMEDQVGSFSSRGITSVKAGSCSDHETSQRIINGEYQLVFISPEALLSKKRWRKMLLCDVYQRNLVAVVVDEAHCVRNWYVELTY